MAHISTRNQLPMIPSIANGNIASFSDGRTGAPMHEIAISISSLSGITSLKLMNCNKNFANIIPFAQWNTLFAYKAIQNILPKDTELIMSFVDKDPTIDLTGHSMGFISGDYTGQVSPQGSEFHWCLVNGNISSNTKNKADSGDNLLNSLFFYPATEEAYNKIFSRYNIQIEIGSTSTQYVAFDGDYNEIQLGRTVTTGTLYAVSGKLHIGNYIYDTTPVSVNALEGLNNVYADTGSTEVKYIRRID